jgi:hypothetical protein
MKKLLTLLVLVGVLGGGGYVWFNQSIFKTLLELRDAVEKADVARVEERADLDKFAENAVDFGAALGEAAAKDATGDAGAALVKGLTDIFRGGVQAQLKPQIKDEMRATIAEGKFPEIIGPFKPREGYDALSDIVTLSPTKKRVLIVGTCEDEPAIAEIDFDRVPKGPFDLLGTWKAVGMEQSAVKRLAEVCYAGAKKKSAKKS